MEINMTGDPLIDNLKSRTDTTASKIMGLAYERLQLTRQVEEIDNVIGQLEGAQAANNLVKRDIDLRDTIAQAQKEKAEAEVEPKVKNKEAENA